MEPVDYSRKWYVMLAVAMGIFLGTIDGSIVNIALPTLTRAFGAEFGLVQWVVLGYLLTITTLMLSVGRLADMIGKKSLYLNGFIVFTIGSVLCGLSPTIYWLIGFRILQAVGAAMMMALGVAIITEAFPPSERGKALGIGGSIVSVGVVIGPTLGGVLIDALSWRWIFFVNLPVGIVGSFMVSRFVPVHQPPGGQQFDFAGAITLFISLTSLLLALTMGQRAGFAAPHILLLFAIWLIFLILFLGLEWRIEQPMIDLRLFQNNLFSINLLTGFLSFLTISGTILLIPFYLENVLGYNTRLTGLLLAAIPVAMGLTAPLSGSLSDRFGTRPITVIGLLILVGGYYGVTTLSQDTTGLGYVLRFLPIGIGMGVFQSPNNSAIMGSAPRERLGVASGLLSISRTLGQTSGVALLGALWAARVFHHAPDSIPGKAPEAAAATQVLALQDTYLVTVFIMAIALLLATWALIQEQRARQARSLRSQPFLSDS